MKELSIEQKAKAYDEAISKMKEIMTMDNAPVIPKEIGECIFPELAESEDEKIRKALIEYFNEQCDMSDWNGVYGYQVIAWLEKQGEPKPQVYKTEDGEIITYSETDGYKVEPKFKVGDWIVDNCGYIWKIQGVVNQFYLIEGLEGVESRPTIEWVNKTFHLWTIHDAKDGDVLTTSAGAFIYNGNRGGGSCPGSYCGINTLGSFEIGVESHWTGKTVYPATKEQRDFLFQEMKKDGYKWDSKKKELKKIENEIEIPFGVKDSELQEATYYIPKGFHAEIDDDKVVIKKGEKPTKWSEDDKKMLNLIIDIFEVNHPNGYFKANELNDPNMRAVYTEEIVAWLKSLKDRIQPKQEWNKEDEKFLKTALWHISNSISNGDSTDIQCDTTEWLKSLKNRVSCEANCTTIKEWKPSDLQIEALESATENCAYSEYQDCLRDLIKQLKKL